VGGKKKGGASVRVHEKEGSLRMIQGKEFPLRKKLSGSGEKVYSQDNWDFIIESSERSARHEKEA